MKRIIIFGNSGSGKSTLAKQLCLQLNIAHLDLDELAWQNTTPPIRQPHAVAAAAIQGFVNSHDEWLVEGCYTDLLDELVDAALQAIYIDLPIEQCLQNAKVRAWEPHKYPSKSAQDKNLAMLLEWIAQYPKRTDTFSQLSHRNLFERFVGDKIILTENFSNVTDIIEDLSQIKE